VPDFSFLDDQVQHRAPPASRPARRPQSRPMPRDRVMTIQKTSKGLKAGQALAWLTVFCGVGFLMAGGSSKSENIAAMGGFTLTVGVLWVFINRVQRWWHHG